MTMTKPKPKLSVLERRSIKRAIWRPGHVCYWCHRPLSKRKATIDHYVPRSRGGSNSPDNIVLACLKCNQERHHRVIVPIDATQEEKAKLTGRGVGGVARLQEPLAVHPDKHGGVTTSKRTHAGLEPWFSVDPGARIDDQQRATFNLEQQEMQSCH